MMKFVCLLLLFVATSAFRVQPFHGKFRISHGTVLKMSSEKPKYDIVPLDKVNIENASAVTGGILGLVLGGPVFALFLAAITNYVAKKENDSGEAIRGLGKTVIESYNYLNKINTKYLLTDKITGTVTKAVSSADADSEAVETVKKAYTTTTSKLAELNKQYDLTSKGKELLVAAGTLSDAALDKLVDLNKKVTALQYLTFYSN